MFRPQALNYKVRCSCGRIIPKNEHHWIRTDITFDKARYMTVHTLVKCIKCIEGNTHRPVGHAVSIEPDPEGDSAVNYWVRRLGLREVA